MSGRVERRINDEFYFVIDEVGGSSGIESENGTDDEVMPNSKGVALPVEISVDENNINMSVILDAGNKLTVKGCETDVGADSDNQNTESITISTNEHDTSGEGSMSGSKDKRLGNPGCPNTEPINMDIDNDSDGEIKGMEREKMKPIIKISFRDEGIEKMYKSSILKYFTQKIHSCTVACSSANNLEIEIYDGKSGKEQDEDVLDFHLDTTPNFDAHSNRVPSYGKNHDVLLSDSHSAENTVAKSEPSCTVVCFNCCGSHVLHDCPHARNMKEIIKNRNKFKSTNKVQRASRYHLDKNQKFGDLVPGELTKNLRNALDLQKDQQPLFIYRMRLLGYPPAWLEEARVSHSGVAIYDSNGVPVSEEDEEEGEIIPEGSRDRFDISKIIEFPGFNVPLQKNMKEEGKYHCCPALSEEQSKDNMIKTLEPNAVQAYKKRSLTIQKYSSQEGNLEKPEKRLPSPTIEEMEEKKRQLLMALNDENDEKVPEPAEPIGKDNSSSDEGCVIKKSRCGTPKPENVKTLNYGTPILKSISPYSKLPTREQFSVNVSDMINFENLPNSTGKYKSMSNLINKIRNTVTRIQNE